MLLDWYNNGLAEAYIVGIVKSFMQILLKGLFSMVSMVPS
jgi:hypothetical protein